MRDRWHKIREMQQSESTKKTPPPTTTKRFHISMMVNQIFKLFASSNHTQNGAQKPDKSIVLPSISVTSPEGQTTVVE